MLKDKVVLIAGATGALGAAVTHTFAATAARLVLVSTSEDKLAALADDIDLSAERVFTAPVDATDADEVAAMVEAVLAHYGRIDVLINTVGAWRGGNPVHETEVAAWERTLDVNLRTAFLLSRAVLPSMLDAGWGRILHTGSKGAVAPRANQAGYAVAKMGLITLTETIAAEVEGAGVTANVVLPSIIDTPANRQMMSGADTDAWVPPEDIAALFRFLCTEAGASINGARLPIYGEV